MKINIKNAMIFIMIAQRELQFLLQGGPGFVSEPRRKHYDGYFCLQLAVNGKIKLSYGQNVSIHSTPVLWLSYPGPLIGYEPLEPKESWIHRYLAFCGPLAYFWWKSGLLPRKPVDLGKDNPWTDLFDKILEFPLSTQKAWDHEEKINRLEYFFLKLIRLGEQKNEEKWLSEAKRLLGDTRHFHPNVAGVARAVHMAISTFRRRFKEATGLSPQNWFINQRMQAARELLEDRSYSIGEIAEQLGYSSVYQFSKQFKASSSLSPNQWRNAHQEVEEL